MRQTKEEILKKEYPLHWAVFRKDLEELSEVLEENSDDTAINKVDVRGRTPLMLAITLGHVECARVLLEKGADACTQNSDMWSLSHEAISLGDAELVRLVLQYRDYQRAVRTSQAMERLLGLLKESPDFYAEMSWQFTSWLPFVSKMCPSDTYKIYKRGSDVRIDTTLVGFDTSSNWKRGNQSFIFRFSDNNQAQLVTIDHDKRTATVQTMMSNVAEELSDFVPPDEAVYSRMTAPIDTTYVDVEKIGFERSKTGGILSWITSSDRTEFVDNYECKVFNACNVEIITKTRTEHLLDEDKERYKQEENNSPLQTILRLVEKREVCTTEMKRTGNDVYCGLTPAQYLDNDYPMKDRDIGRPKQVTRKSNSFKATLWLSDDYPLNLQAQILPIIDLMAVNNAHFARLKNFIQLQLPAGFPVKIEIPLFHVVSARITFANINKSGPYVHFIENENRVTIDEETFQVPVSYRSLDESDIMLGLFDVPPRAQLTTGQGQGRRYIPEDELYLQFALEQSMREAAGMTVNSDESLYRSIMFSADGSETEMDPDLACAIAESLRSIRADAADGNGGTSPAELQAGSMDDDLRRALQLSKQDEDERIRLEREQEEELERVLKLSMVEK